jgi:hypothetical protein
MNILAKIIIDLVRDYEDEVRLAMNKLREPGAVSAELFDKNGGYVCTIREVKPRG